MAHDYPIEALRPKTARFITTSSSEVGNGGGLPVDQIRKCPLKTATPARLFYQSTSDMDIIRKKRRLIAKADVTPLPA